MITAHGNIFSSDAEALVNPVNCVGVMGAGLAKQFKQRYADNFKAYQVACQAGELVIGKIFVHALKQPANPRFIFNFPTKYHWRDKSELEDIRLGLTALTAEIINTGVNSVAIPAVGCGLGGLPWWRVRPVIADALRILPVAIYLFEPSRGL
jgi:O-acetyl-ADP-ribose deacetylase (regulator of RNase III)